MKRSHSVIDTDAKSAKDPSKKIKNRETENAASTRSTDGHFSADDKHIKNRQSNTKHNDSRKRAMEMETDIDPATLPQGVKDLAENIERNAAQTKLTAKNVKSILHHLFSDKKLLDFVKKAALDMPEHSEESSVSCSMEPIMTRSKWKMKQCKTKTDTSFIKADFAEDSEDEEYKPENESNIAASDDDESISTTFSDQLSPSSLGTPDKAAAQTDDVATLEDQNADLYSMQQNFVMHKDGTMFRMPTMPVPAFRIKDHTDDEIEIIANRTRSKFSMKDLSLEALEASFDPPDYDPALYDNQITEEMDPDDLEWKNWLNKLVHTDEVDESMDENDEDFNFMAMEETFDKEEFRTDKGARIPHKELEDLFDEVLNDFDEYIEDETTIIRCLMPQLPMMTLPQRILLSAQLQQHTQLLCQTYLLTMKEPLLCKESKNCMEYIKELVNFRDAMRRNSSTVDQSMYSFQGLDDALRIIDSPDVVFESEPMLSQLETINGAKNKDKKPRKNDSIIHMPLRVGLRIFLEPYFATYPELLPKQGLAATKQHEELSTEASRLKFFQSEDSLLALGLSQFGHEYDLIAQYLLPAKTPKQLKTRSKNLTSKREYENPVKVFRRDGILPILTVKTNIIGPRPTSSRSIKQSYRELSYRIRIPNWLERMHGHMKLIEDERNKQACLTASYFAYAARNNLRPIVAKPSSSIQLPVTVIAPMVSSMPRIMKVDQSVQTSLNPSKVPENGDKGIEADAVHESKIEKCNQDIQNEIMNDNESCSKEKSTEKLSNVDSIATSVSCISKDHCNYDADYLKNAAEVFKEKDKVAEANSLSSLPVDPNDIDADGRVTSCNVPVSDESGNYSCDDEAEDKELKEINAEDVGCVADTNFDSAVEEETVENAAALSEQNCVKEIDDNNLDQDVKNKETIKAKRTNAIMDRDKQASNREFNWNDKLQEKALKFADLYFQKVKETLADDNALYCEFLRLITEAGTTGTSKVELYWKLAKIFKDHFNLVEMFVGFLEPCEAEEVGQFRTWLEFEKAKYFLLKCEATFVRPKYYHQLLRKIVKLQETGMEPKRFVETITPLFRGNSHLVVEFSTFFQDVPPPQSRIEDYEVIKYRPELGDFDHLDVCEEVKLKHSDIVDPGDYALRKKAIPDDFAAWLQKPALNIIEAKTDSKRSEACSNVFKSNIEDDKEKSICAFGQDGNQKGNFDTTIKTKSPDVRSTEAGVAKQIIETNEDEMIVENDVSDIHLSDSKDVDRDNDGSNDNLDIAQKDASLLGTKIYGANWFDDKLKVLKVDGDRESENGRKSVLHLNHQGNDRMKQTNSLANEMQILTCSDLLMDETPSIKPCELASKSTDQNSFKEKNQLTKMNSLTCKSTSHESSLVRQIVDDPISHYDKSNVRSTVTMENTRSASRESVKGTQEHTETFSGIKTINESWVQNEQSFRRKEAFSSPETTNVKTLNSQNRYFHHSPSLSFDGETSNFELSESPSGTKLKKFRLNVRNTDITSGFQKIDVNTNDNTDCEFVELEKHCEAKLEHEFKTNSNDDKNESQNKEENSVMESQLFDRTKADETLNTFSAGDIHYNERGEFAFKWSKDDDRIILTACQTRGPADSTFSRIAEQLVGRSKAEIRQRFMKLMELYRAAAK